MKTIENGCREYLAKRNLFVKETDYSCKYYPTFKAGVEFAEQYTSVDDKLPDALKPDDLGIFYSDYLLIKVRGYEHPFVGFYVKAEDDEFFDFIHNDIDMQIKQVDIIGWRLIEHK